MEIEDTHRNSGGIDAARVVVAALLRYEPTARIGDGYFSLREGRLNGGEGGIHTIILTNY